MFYTNIFSFASRKAVCEHAYHATRRDLLARYDELAPILARHGIRLRKDVLLEPRDLWNEVGLDGGSGRGKAVSDLPVEVALDRALTRLEAWVEGR
jgi:hypothetical protein